ncbi:MAG: peptidoglycan-associated lipoprotein Pal [Desulfobacterales bacterium]|nr:peptidoglycan-associated lipoprotein Pal [Desulfobacterales bacterium]
MVLKKMRNTNWFVIMLLFISISLVSLTACGGKKKAAEQEAIIKSQQADAEKKAAEDRESALRKQKEREIEEARLREEQIKRDEEDKLRRERDIKIAAEREEREQFLNESIYFEYDSSDLTSEAREILDRKSKWLMTNYNVSIIIEGHCDERGTNDYNMALGDRRAESARTYLVNRGIAISRITTISFGEERPIAFGNTEDAWAKNRRDMFVIP